MPRPTATSRGNTPEAGRKEPPHAADEYRRALASGNWRELLQAYALARYAGNEQPAPVAAVEALAAVAELKASVVGMVGLAERSGMFAVLSRADFSRMGREVVLVASAM